nr:MAG TPA: hypothetical protein [Caudoviricetes sp.]
MRGIHFEKGIMRGFSCSFSVRVFGGVWEQTEI